MKRTCWSFTSQGLCSIGQDDIVFLLECLDGETVPPSEVFHHIALLSEQANQGTVIFNMLGGCNLIFKGLIHCCEVLLVVMLLQCG